MMLALVLIVASDTAPRPVSAVPRSLSDYALEHRELLRVAGAEAGNGAGVFSAAETTIPRDPLVFLPALEEKPEPEPPEPAAVVVPPVYGPVWWAQGGGRRQASSRIRQRPALHVAASPLAPRPLAGPSAPPAHQERIVAGGRALRP